MTSFQGDRNSKPQTRNPYIFARMQELVQKIEDYRKEIETFEIANAQQLEEYRIKFLGTKGIVKAVFGEMKNVAPEKKREAGQVLNEFKQYAEAKYEEAKQSAI